AAALERRQPRDVDRQARAVLLVNGAAAGGEELLELLRHRGADPGNAAQPLGAALAIDVGERPIVRLDGLGGLLVCPRLELHAVHLEVGGEVAEDASEAGGLPCRRGSTPGEGPRELRTSA